MTTGKNRIIALMLCCLVLSSCAAHIHNDIHPEVKYGFFYGLWHGVISPVTFVISLFSDNITVWETHNNGGWYTFGFLLGVGALGSSTKSTK